MNNILQLLCRMVENGNRASAELLFLCFCLRKVTKESLVETSSNITESLMSISRMMAEQVKQSEDSIGVLCKSFYTFGRVRVCVQMVNPSFPCEKKKKITFYVFVPTTF